MNDISFALTFFTIFFVACLAFLPQSCLFDFGLRLYRKLGWTQMAEKWEYRKHWWLPLERIIVGILVIILVVIQYVITK